VWGVSNNKGKSRRGKIPPGKVGRRSEFWAPCLGRLGWKAVFQEKRKPAHYAQKKRFAGRNEKEVLLLKTTGHHPLEKKVLKKEGRGIWQKGKVGRDKEFTGGVDGEGENQRLKKKNQWGRMEGCCKPPRKDYHAEIAKITLPAHHLERAGGRSTTRIYGLY